MSDFKNMSERYRKQMIDLYKRYPQDIPPTQRQNNNKENILLDTSQDDIINTNVNDEPTEYTIEPFETFEEPYNISNNETDNNTLTDNNISIEEKYPTPVIPPFIYQDNKDNLQIVPQNTSPTIIDQNQIGYLKVVVTSADQTVPLSNVSVIISKNNEIIYSLLTNDSGETETVELLAPIQELSESPTTSNIKPYAEYNITAYLHGYYQIINTSVPIFANITSIQRINMIPLPSYTTERKVIKLPEIEPNL